MRVKFIQMPILVLATIFAQNALLAQPCNASFVYTISGATVTFSSTSTYSSLVTPTLNWDFGNGMGQSSASQTAAITYTSNSKYGIRLTVNTQPPSSCGYFDTITVLIPGCSLLVNGSLTCVPPNNGEVVSFTANAAASTSNTSYLWQISNGLTFTSQVVTHTFSEKGHYEYTLTATENPTCSAIYNYPEFGWGYYGFFVQHPYTAFISSTLGAQGQATFSAEPFYNFTNLGWNFGDAHSFAYYYPNSPTQTTINHTYFNGTYTAKFQCFVGSVQYWDSMVVNISNNPCIVNSSFNYTSVGSGAYQFSPTAAPSSSNIAYLWNFGDGVVSNMFSPSHVYSNAGAYSVSLMCYNITNSLACQQTSTSIISVTNIPCVANSGFSITQVQGVPHLYYITPAYPWNISNVIWDWGDNSTSNVLYTNHTYSASGTYSICMNVTVSCGSSSTTCINQFIFKQTVPSNMIQVNVVPPELVSSISESTNLGDNTIPWRIFPNPVDNNLFIESESPFDLFLFDLNGKIIFSEHLREGSSQINTTSLPAGLYILHLSNATQSHRARVVKME